MQKRQTLLRPNPGKMLLTLLIFCTTASSVWLFTACSSGPADGLNDLQRAESVKKLIVGHEKWKQHPKFAGLQKSTDNTHGTFVKVWFNDKAASVFGNLKGEFPDGSLIVKRGFKGEKGTEMVKFVTVFQKVKGLDPENGDWFTVRVWDNDISPLSSYRKEDRATDCMNCHSTAKEKFDWVRFPLDKKVEF